MKVAINGRFLLPRLEGIGHYTYHLLDQLSLRHPEDEYHIILDRAYYIPLMDRPNVIRHIIGPHTRHPIIWYYWFEWRLPSLLKKINPDIFFSPDGFLSLNANVPKLLTIHDLAYIHFPHGTQRSHLRHLRKYMPQYIAQADEIIAVSQFTADDITRQHRVSADKITTIYNGVSSDFQPLKETDQIAYRKHYADGKPYFLYVGAIHPRKNVANLVRAFDRYKRYTHDDTLLILAGRKAWYTKEVDEAIKLSSCRLSIVHIEDIDDIVPQLIGSADALCYPSLFEGFGLPVLEAMACGIDVITSKDSAMQEICGDLAYYVDPLEIESMTEAMITFRSDQKKGVTNKEKLRLAASRYTWEKAAILIHERLLDVSSSNH